MKNYHRRNTLRKARASSAKGDTAMMAYHVRKAQTWGPLTLHEESLLVHLLTAANQRAPR